MKLTVIVRSIVLAVVVALVVPLAAHAQAWPARQPIKFVIAYPPGGASDVTARILGVKLSASLGQTVVIENRPGANGIIALEFVAKSAPDGYTILMANVGPNSINPVVYSKLPYDAIKDFQPVTLTSQMPLVLVVTPSLPVKSVRDLIAYGQAHPGKLNFASAGIGASNHLTGELFNRMAGIKMVHVPYKGDSPAMTDVMSGTVDVMFPTAIAAMGHVKSGRLHALAVTTSKRISSLPDVPTVAEGALPGFEAVAWGGVMVPAGTPPEIVNRLNAETNRALKLPDVTEKLASLGAEVIGTTPEEFATYLKGEIAKWGKVARENQVKLD